MMHLKWKSYVRHRTYKQFRDCYSNYNFVRVCRFAVGIDYKERVVRDANSERAFEVTVCFRIETNPLC